MNENKKPLKPCFIDFPRIGRGEIGYIGVAESEALPFEVQRVFWTYFTPESVIRGRHAHYETEMILLAVSGKIIVKTETIQGRRQVFTLERPDRGLFIPSLCWHTMEYSHTATQVVLASTAYNEEEYIRNYDDFKALRQTARRAST